MLPAFFVCTCRNGCPRCHPDAEDRWFRYFTRRIHYPERKPFSVRLDELQL